MIFFLQASSDLVVLLFIAAMVAEVAMEEAVAMAVVVVETLGPTSTTLTSPKSSLSHSKRIFTWNIQM